MNKNLEEVINNYKINPNHRAWYISIFDGKILGGYTHMSIIKENFTKYWKELEDKGEEESAIFDTLGNRMIHIGNVKIGEYEDNLYVTLRLGSNDDKIVIQKFAASLVKAKKYDIQNCKMFMEGIHDHKVVSYSIKEILDGCLLKR